MGTSGAAEGQREERGGRNMEKGRGACWENWKAGGFAAVVKLRDLQWDVIGIISGALNAITSVL